MSRLLYQVTICLLLLNLGMALPLLAQEPFTWDDFVQRYLTDEEASETANNLRYEQISELHENPQNLNEVGRAGLSLLPFLTEEQIEEILAYRYSVGRLMSLGELSLIKGLDYETRRALPLFFYVAPTQRGGSDSLKYKFYKEGKHEIVTRLDWPLYQRAGYKNYSDSILQRYPNRKYLGGPCYSSVRYQYNYRNRIAWGLNAEKDPGEPFGKKGNGWGYDYYSFHLLLKEFGPLKTLALGDFRLNFGQGLVVNNDYTLGISSLLNSTNKAEGVKRNGSMNEHNFFRGAALTLQFNPIELTSFVSYRKLDATLNNDSLTVSSIKEDGYHRTPLEMSKKNNLHDFTLGGNITYQKNGFRVGVTGVYNYYSRVLEPRNDLYRLYYPRGRAFYSLGSAYSYRHPRFTLQGEMATTQKGALATSNKIDLKLNDSYHLILMQRYFSHRYYATYANSVSEGGRVQNENGVLVGVRATPSRKITYLAYLDIFFHPFAKYQVARESYGQTLYTQVEYRLSSGQSLLFRYRYKQKQKDYSQDELAYNRRQTLKIQYNYLVFGKVKLRTAADYTQINNKGETSSRGYMFSQSLSSNLGKVIQATLDGMLFFTDDYESRLYGYEHGLLYTFNFPAYYYHGIRTALVVRSTLSKRWMILAKYGLTHYFNRDEIGSSQQLIEGSTKSDIYLQLRYKF